MDLVEAPFPGRRPKADRAGLTHRRRAGRLHASASGATSTDDPCSRSLQASGPRGELRFRLQYHHASLYVEREEIPCRGLHCVQSMQFQDVRQFERWCDGDPARFDHPLLHLALKRDALALWQLREPCDA